VAVFIVVVVVVLLVGVGAAINQSISSPTSL
jgi:hypothetical protein